MISLTPSPNQLPKLDTWPSQRGWPHASPCVSPFVNCRKGTSSGDVDSTYRTCTVAGHFGTWSLPSFAGFVAHHNTTCVLDGQCQRRKPFSRRTPWLVGVWCCRRGRGGFCSVVRWLEGLPIVNLGTSLRTLFEALAFQKETDVPSSGMELLQFKSTVQGRFLFPNSWLTRCNQKTSQANPGFPPFCCGMCYPRVVSSTRFRDIYP